MRSVRVVGVLAAAVVLAGASAAGGTGLATTSGPTTAGTTATPSTSPAGMTAAEAATRPGATSSTLTLVTGDVARLTVLPDGRQIAGLERPHAPGEPYFVGEYDGDVRLIPAEAMPYVSAGRLDDRLFNLTELVAQGYADQAGPGVPLLLTAAGRARRAPTPPAPSTLLRSRHLASVDAVAVTPRRQAARAFWESIDDDSPSGAVTLAGGIGKVWLDGRVRASLDESVPQIGAPAAWKAGLTGAGVKVAVLDSGYDDAHPDLAGRVAGAATFVPGQAVRDGFGHGTHVAATVAGTGAASGGSRRGVAPGASLLVGKVLDDSGSGQVSWAIAGMEWAVEQGAKVVSMSLGTAPTDGSDPLSTAVDQLSASSGALFVVAAGNAGPAEGSVGAPAAATSALAVGAVTKRDELARSSSRGPRLGDGAVKPEITAPGVDIVAARAAGTTLGSDVSETYTSMSGTSMATPHVAGAAAILAQRHPDWTGAQLKTALAASAEPVRDASAAAQGTGRVSVAAALRQRVVPSTASVSFGDLSWTGEPRPAVTRQVTYHNTGTKAVRLNLDLDLAPLEAGSATRPEVSLSARTLRVDPGATAAVTLRLDTDRTPAGSYAGRLVARGPDGAVVRTAVGFTVGSQTHEVRVSAVDREGRPAVPSSGVQLWNVDTGSVRVLAFGSDGSRTLQVPSGRYALMVFVFTPDAAGWTDAVAILGRPDLRITASTSLAFDARTAEPMTITTPKRTDPEQYVLAWHRELEGRSAMSGWSMSGQRTERVYVQRFPAVRAGSFHVTYRGDHPEPQLTVDVEGPDAFRLPTPQLAGWTASTPVYVGTERRRVVDGGDGTPEELAEVDAAGAVVLLRWGGSSTASRVQVAAATKAGAAVVLLYKDSPGYWSDAGTGATIPCYALEQPEGRRLLDAIRAGDGTASVRLHGIAQATYRYDLMFAEDEVRGPLRYDARRLPLAEVATGFHRHDGPAGQVRRDFRAAFLPGSDVAFELGRQVSPPHRRTDYVTAGDVEWTTRSLADTWTVVGEEFGVPRTYRPGERVTQQRWSAISRPAVPDLTGGEADGLPVARFEDALRVAIPQFVSGDGQVYGWGHSRQDRTALVLRRNGVEIGRADWSVARFLVPREQASYELELDVDRLPDSWATTSTATRTVWRFRSGHVSGREVLPLLQVRYVLDTDLANALDRRRPGRLQLSPAYQPGGRGPGRFRTAAEVSYDEGGTWQPLRLTSRRGGGTVTGALPAAGPDARTGALRVTVTDGAGNGLTQRIDGAWHVTDR